MRRLTAEDGIVETAQAVFYFILASIFFHFTVIIARERECRKATKIGYLVLAVLFLFIALEEISWGQRIIGFDTPGSLEEQNYQEETTVHNLGNYWSGIFFYLYSASVIAFVFLFGVLLPILKCRFKNMKVFLDRNRIPIPQLELVFGFILGSLFICKEDYVILQLLVLVIGTAIGAFVLLWSGPSVVDQLKASKLLKLQLLAIVLTIPAIIAINLFTNHFSRPMTETREFFISLTFLLFGIVTLMERNSREPAGGEGPDDDATPANLNTPL